MTLLMIRSASSVIISLVLAENRWALYWLTTGEMGVGVVNRGEEWVVSCGRRCCGSCASKKSQIVVFRRSLEGAIVVNYCLAKIFYLGCLRLRGSTFAVRKVGVLLWLRASYFLLRVFFVLGNSTQCIFFVNKFELPVAFQQLFSRGSESR